MMVIPRWHSGAYKEGYNPQMYPAEYVSTVVKGLYTMFVLRYKDGTFGTEEISDVKYLYISKLEQALK